MKKSLFFAAAASALMLTACSSENDVVQSPTNQNTATVQQQAVGFDIYTPAATNVTRAGLEGTMTTNRLQLPDGKGGGFGIYAFLTEDNVDAAGDGANAKSYTPTAGQDPNFMVNEKILWDADSKGWFYNPLKYWPNETDNDSQSSAATMEGTPKHLDRLTFFAYAPYVSAGSGTTGITAITDKDGKLSGGDVTDPTIKYVSTDTPTDVDPDKYVDLLWGVAPSGGLEYTAVNGWTVKRNEGTPLIDMIKPNVNTSMKFLFNHALARFGVTVVAAVDQVSPGGTLDENTKITIEKFTISGPFGIIGDLNLNNGTNASIANWTEIQNTTVTSDKKAISTTQSISVQANATNNAIAPHLRWTSPHDNPQVQPVVGVTTAKQDLLRPSNKWYTKLSGVPTYSPAKQYYTYDGSTYTVAQAKFPISLSDGIFKLSGNNYNSVTGTINAPAYPNAITTGYCTIAPTSYTAGTDPNISEGSTKLYIKNGNNYEYKGTYTEMKAANSNNWGTSSGIYDHTATYYSIVPTAMPLSSFAYAYPSGTYYEAERNYLYVVPTNNVAKNAGLTADQEKALRTITVQIEYYITTEDSKLAAERAQTKNVVTKVVELPSLANSKSYNLNLVLGLTSVKIEAEVDDWKVVNSQVDLPQNTGE